MKAALILNHGAGSLNGNRDAVTPDGVRDALVAAGFETTLRVAPPSNLAGTLRAALAEQPDAVFVGGGDGTIATAAGCLAGNGVPLGVLPLGTLNHFARDLGLPVDWREAIAALGRGVVRSVDLGEVNGRAFINNCSLGSYAEAVRRREHLRHERGAHKGWAMALASFAVFRELRRHRMRIESGGATHHLRTPFVVVANNRYSGRVLDYSLRPRLDEGRLWIYTTRAGRRLSILRLFWQSLFRDIDDVDDLEQQSAIEATIARDHGSLPIAVDGELVNLAPPLRFHVRPEALQVLVPREPITSQ